MPRSRVGGGLPGKRRRAVVRGMPQPV